MSSNHNTAGDVAAASEVKRLLAEDTTPWYKKPNLLKLYLLLVPAALGVEMTTGYDGSVLNGLQAVDLWNEHFGNPHGAILGVATSSLAIGTAIGVLFMPYINDRFGRKICVILGSIVVAVGVVIQTCAINSTFKLSNLSISRFYRYCMLTLFSGNAYRLAYCYGSRISPLPRWRCSTCCRACIS